MDESIITEAFALYQPVVEAAVVFAAEYCKGAGRTIVVGKDMEYGMKYATRKVLGTMRGTAFPEITDDSDDDEDDDAVEELLTEDIDEEWTRYEGDDERLQLVNHCYDTWDEWEPDTPAAHALKSAIEKSV